jgi:hypothetical protein
MVVAVNDFERTPYGRPVALDVESGAAQIGKVHSRLRLAAWRGQKRDRLSEVIEPLCRGWALGEQWYPVG